LSLARFAYYFFAEADIIPAFQGCFWGNGLETPGLAQTLAGLKTLRGIWNGGILEKGFKHGNL
jgi:hypothetical protein